jgi:hypothetical protein
MKLIKTRQIRTAEYHGATIETKDKAEYSEIILTAPGYRAVKRVKPRENYTTASVEDINSMALRFITDRNLGHLR